MKISDALIQRVKWDIDPRTLLRLLSIDWVDRGHLLRATCPSPDHDDKSPSWDMGCDDSIQEGDAGLWFCHYRCLSCGRTGDAITLVMMVQDMIFTDAVTWMADAFGFKPHEEGWKPSKEYQVPRRVREKRVRKKLPKIQRHMIPILENIHGERYVERAGIPEWQVNRHQLLWNTKKSAPVFPVFDSRGVLVDLETRPDPRSNTKSVSYPGADHAMPFGTSLFEPEQSVVIIVEGFFEYLRLERMGYIGVGLAARTSKILPIMIEIVRSMKLAIVLPDVDAGGMKLWESAMHTLKYRPDGEVREVRLALLPCSTCEYAKECDQDADACRRDSWIHNAIESPLKTMPKNKLVEYVVPRRRR